MASSGRSSRAAGAAAAKGPLPGQPRQSSTAATPTLRERVRRRLSGKLDVQKNRVTDALDDVAETVRRMGEPLRDQPYAGLEQYTQGAADRIERVATGLRERDVEDLAHELGEFARRRPAMFLGAGFAAGVLAARFLKSSAGQSEPAGGPTSGQQALSASRSSHAEEEGRRENREAGAGHRR